MRDTAGIVETTLVLLTHIGVTAGLAPDVARALAKATLEEFATSVMNGQNARAMVMAHDERIAHVLNT
jgi:hypothetical protein